MPHSPPTTLGLFALLTALTACAADDPERTLPEGDLLLRIELAPDDISAVTAYAASPTGAVPSVPALGPRGDLALRFVDQATGTVSAGRIAAGGESHHERFGIAGQIFAEGTTTSDTVRVRVPMPAEGDAELTLSLRLPDGTVIERAFALSLSLDAPLPVSGTAVEVAGTSEALLSGASETVGATRAALGWDDVFGKDSECGNGEVEEERGALWGLIGGSSQEQCDDGNDEDGDGCTTECKNEMVHVGGAESADSAVVIAFIPGGWGDLDAFELRARFHAASMLQSDWYSEHADDFSLWALVDQDADDLGAIACDRGALTDRIDDLMPFITDAEYGGSPASPDIVVGLTPDDCRSFAWVNMSLIEGTSGTVMAHEMGHAFGLLADEYSVAFGRLSCGEFSPFDANLATLEPGDEPPWACISGGRDGASCPERGSVGAWTVGLDTDRCGDDRHVVVPCTSCMMSISGPFCPVCRGTLEARLSAALGEEVSERPSNGVDDDLDGDTDEGSSCDACTPLCAPGTYECGDDGCFGSCGGCGAGEACINHRCRSDCDVSCGRDSLGRETCAGQSFFYACRQAPTGSCTIDADCVVANAERCIGTQCMRVGTYVCGDDGVVGPGEDPDAPRC